MSYMRSKFRSQPFLKEVRDAIEQNDFPRFKKAVNYCNLDSIKIIILEDCFLDNQFEFFCYYLKYKIKKHQRHHFVNSLYHNISIVLPKKPHSQLFLDYLINQKRIYKLNSLK